MLRGVLRTSPLPHDVEAEIEGPVDDIIGNADILRDAEVTSPKKCSILAQFGEATQ